MTGDKFMLELHLKQPKFTYSVCETFTKHYEKIQKFRETGNLKHLHRNELSKTCFIHNAANSKDLTKRIIFKKILKDRAYEIARNCEYGGYQRALARIFYTFLIIKKTESGVRVNEQLIEELKKELKEEKSMWDLKTILGSRFSKNAITAFMEC